MRVMTVYTIYANTPQQLFTRNKVIWEPSIKNIHKSLKALLGTKSIAL